MKKFSFLAILIIILVTLSACSSKSAGTSAASNQEQPNDKIVISEAFHSLLYIPLYVGMSEGIFEENGIEISSLSAAGTGPIALTSVIAGEADFSLHGPEHVSFAQEKGGSAKIVTAMANSAPIWILANENVEFNSPADLKGKKIVVGSAPGTSNTLLKILLEKNGLDYNKDVIITEVQLGSELGPVLAGAADIAVAYQPQADQGIGQGLKVIYDFTGDYPDFAFSTFNTSQKLIDEKPDMIKRFVKAVDESMQLVHDNPDLAKEVAKKEFPELEPAVLDKAIERMINSKVYPETAKVSEEAFQVSMSLQKFVGNLKSDVKYEDVIYKE